MKKLGIFIILILFCVVSYSQNNAVYKRVSLDTLKSRTGTKKMYLKDTVIVNNIIRIPAGATDGNIAYSNASGDVIWGTLPSEADSLFISYCCGCNMIDGWKALEDTIKIDTCYINTIIKDSLNAHWIILNSYIQDSAKIVHWSDTITKIATKHDVDTLSNSVYDSLSNHYDLIHGLDTGKVSTSGDIMYGDLNVNADVHADTVHAIIKQSVYLNSLASWDSQGVLNDTIIPKNVSDTLYNKIVAIRPNKPDTSFANIDLIANTTLFPKGTYFHVYKGSYTATVNLARDSCVLYFDAESRISKTTGLSMFDYSAITKGCDVLGYGTFKVSSTCLNVINTTHPFYFPYTFTFEADSIISSTSGITISSNSSVNVRIHSLLVSGGDALTIVGNGTKANINIVNLIATGGKALNRISISNSINCNYNGSYISSNTYGVYGDGNLNINCPYIIGTTAAMYIAGVYPNITLNGSCYSKTKITGGQITGGQHLNVDITGGQLSKATSLCTGGNAFTLLQTGGSSDILITQNIFNPSVTISGGTAKIHLSNHTQGLPNNATQFTVSGTGKLYLSGYWYGQARYGYDISSAYFPITQTGGFIDATGLTMEMNAYNGYFYAFVKKTGGSFKCSNTTFIRTGRYSEPFYCPSTAQNISIYSGGVNYNGSNLLSAKPRQDSIKVNAVAITTIVLNDGSGGAETFTETDVVTYNTTALMAQRIASLINASGTLGITATYVSGATFNIASDVAGTDYTQSGLVNLTNYELAPNRASITDLTGGHIIEDSDVSF